MPVIKTQEEFMELPNIINTPRMRVNAQGLSNSDNRQRKAVA